MILRIFYIFIFLSSPLFAAVIEPILSEADYNKSKAKLGKDLFFDNRLSASSRSCNYCHHLTGEFTGTTKKMPSPPSILNSSLNYYFSKNNEITSMKKQIIDIFSDPEAYNTPPSFFVEQINKNPVYRKKFKEIYGKINFENAVDALSEFIIALRAPSRFDKFINGDSEALNQEEQEGYRIFIKAGCIACHNGSNLGGGMTAVLRKNNGAIVQIRVPSLRNVKRTGPWMSFYSKNLFGAILWLKNSVISVNITPEEVMKVIIFFDSLNSEIPSILKED